MRFRGSKFITTVIILCVIVFAVGFGMVTYQTVEQGNAKIESDSDFAKTKAESVNQKDITLKVNKKTAYPSEGKYFMSPSLNLMIPSDVVERYLNCACLKYKGKTVVVIKANTKAILKEGSSKVKINGSDYTIKEKVVNKNGVIYIPSSLFENYLGFAYKWDNETYTATLTDTALGNALPTRYNYAEEGRLPKVQDQGQEKTCWAYATLSALESSLLPNEKYEFSRRHLINYSEKKNDIRNGGDYEFSLAYLTSWNGPVSDNANGYGKIKKHVQSAQILTPRDQEEMKRMVFKYGGVETSIFIERATFKGSTQYYNASEYAYNYTGDFKPNHDLVVVGWDDNFPSYNFKGNVKKNGAFICLNSWGKDFGEGGFFYVSYECKSFGDVSVCYTQVDDIDNYDSIYQSDLCGWTATMGYDDKQTVYFSNAFTAKKNEKIKAVGFYATQEKSDYDVFICEDYKGAESLNKRTHVAAKASFDNKGYYTLNLDKSYNVEKGKKFSIIVKAHNNNKALKLVPVETTTKSMKKPIDLKDGEGFISPNGKTWQSVEKQKCNVCLKAYTDER
ncbi:MAG: peptidase C1 [Eubacterium sp.]|nr:peptidase C1 [Eubacterium sp.]